jgi:hypothetical protein
VAVEKLDLSELVEKTLRQEPCERLSQFSWTFSIPKFRLFWGRWSLSTATGVSLIEILADFGTFPLVITSVL